VTASVVLPVMTPIFAVMVVIPGFAAVARPEVFMFAKVGWLEFQEVTDAVTFCVEPSA
jgi:hypothetical protein